MLTKEIFDELTLTEILEILKREGKEVKFNTGDKELDIALNNLTLTDEE